MVDVCLPAPYMGAVTPSGRFVSELELKVTIYSIFCEKNIVRRWCGVELILELAPIVLLSFANRFYRTCIGVLVDRFLSEPGRYYRGSCGHLSYKEARWC